MRLHRGEYRDAGGVKVRPEAAQGHLRQEIRREGKVMISQPYMKQNLSRRITATRAAALLGAALILFGSLFESREAVAGAGVAAAAQAADGGVSACSSNTGKALYGCI